MKKRLLAILLTLCMLIGLLPATALANGEGTSTSSGPELDISQGSITITNDGYKLTKDTQVIEGKWSSETHVLTITGTSTNENMIVVKGGNPEITLKNVSIQTSGTNAPGLVLMSGTDGTENKNTATIVLEGVNTLKGGSNAPGVQINKNAALTIRGTGTLNAMGTGNASGIGASNSNVFAINPSTEKSDNAFRSGGELIIEGGIIKATRTGGGDNGYGIGG